MSAAVQIDWSVLGLVLLVAAVCGVLAAVAAYRWTSR